jgi:hypothetical protein
MLTEAARRKQWGEFAVVCKVRGGAIHSFEITNTQTRLLAAK